MFRNVLVPLDGSPLAEQALAAGVAISRRTSARLHLVHVRVPSPPPGDDTVTDPARAYLNEACERVCADIGESVSFAVLPENEPHLLLPAPSPGTVATLIEGYVRTHQVDLVVMATHGRGGLSRLWFGSVAEALLRSCSAPVLIIRPREGAGDERWTSGRAISHVLLPLDGSEQSRPAIEAARSIVATFGARISLLRVLPLPFQALDGLVPAVVVFAADDAIELQESAERSLARVADDLRAAGASVETATVTATSVPNAILDFATEHAVDLIVLATHARTGLDRILMGSVADKLVRGADCPVLVLRETRTPEGNEESRSGRGAEPRNEAAGTTSI